jgi:hypothetical protein
MLTAASHQQIYWKATQREQHGMTLQSRIPDFVADGIEGGPCPNCKTPTPTILTRIKPSRFGFDLRTKKDRD